MYIQFRVDQQFFHHFMPSFSPNLAKKKNNVCRHTVISGKVSTSAGNTSMVARPASGSAPSKARRALVVEECLVTGVPSISPGILRFNIYTINKKHYVDTIYLFIVCTVYIQIVHVNILLLYIKSNM